MDDVQGERTLEPVSMDIVKRLRGQGKNEEADNLVARVSSELPDAEDSRTP
ncbi:MAG: hypothetical protein JNM66_07765 [Bryobacterales bacterium]|nr:hypothetical protein [Bryobacterales bacterium]